MSDLQRSLLKSDLSRGLNRVTIRAILGDGSGRIYDSQNPNSGYVWVQQQTSNGYSTPQRVRGPYQGAPVQMIPGNPVVLKYDTDGQLFVFGPDFQSSVSVGINPNANNASDENAKGWTNQSAIVTLVSTCTAPPSLSVIVRGWMAISNLAITWFNGSSIDLTSLVPSAGNQCIAVIVVKSDYATLAAYASTAKDSTDVLTMEDIQQGLTAAAAVDANAIPIWAWRLHDAQTSITDADSWLDLRQFINLTGGTASPLTTKGDLYTFSTINARLAVGANNSILTPDSAQATGLKWTTALTGLTLDNTPVGASVPSTGLFTSLAADSVAIKAYNGSGATANANDVGYLDYDVTNGYVYKTTTTANLNVAWCVVTNGGGNGANIDVARRGQVTVKLNANCAVGNFLLTSTTAGEASVSTTMRPEVFAVALTANSGGAGGTCIAMLLTQTQFVSAFHTVSLYGVASHSATNPAPTMTINGAPSATSVVYNTPSSGSADTMVPAAANQLGLLILWNSTRSSLRLITAVNTGTKTITTVSSTDSWATGDSITTIGQTVGINTVNELDMSQQTIVPLLARSISFIYGKLSNAAGLTGDIVPYEAFSATKQQIVYTEVANIYTNQPMTVYLINRRFAISLGANGTATDTDTLSLTGYYLAVP